MLPLPPKPKFDPEKPNIYFIRAAKLFNAAKRLGYPNPAAVGMFVVQPDMEASFRPDVVGDNGTAFNICQWHEPRISAILAGCGVDVRTETDFSRLAQAVDWELNHTMAAAGRYILAAETSADAARAACTYFERAGASDAAERRAEDAKWWVTWLAENFPWVEAQG